MDIGKFKIQNANMRHVTVTLPTYYKKDFKQITWQEYGVLLDQLHKKVSTHVKKHRIIIDAVVPVLRGGMVPALFLGHKLHILKCMPVQYKYFFKGKKIQLKKLFDFPRLAFPLPKKPTFLLVEGNHCFGLTAKTAVKDLKKAFPGCTILYVADFVDYSHQNEVPAEKVFYGKLTNETRGLSEKKAHVLGIGNELNLYPWEDLEEEWVTVQGKQFPYKDLKNL